MYYVWGVDKHTLYNQKVSKLISDLKELLYLSKRRNEKVAEFIHVSAPHFSYKRTALENFYKKYKPINTFGLNLLGNLELSSLPSLPENWDAWPDLSFPNTFWKTLPRHTRLETEIPTFEAICTESISTLESRIPVFDEAAMERYLPELRAFESKISVVGKSLKSQILYLQRQISIYGRLSLLSALKRKVLKRDKPNLRIPLKWTQILDSISNSSRLKFLRLNITLSYYLILLNFNNEKAKKIGYRFL